MRHAEADLNRDGQLTNSGLKSNDYNLAGSGGGAGTTTPLAPAEISRSDVHNVFGWNGAVFDAEGGSNGLYLMRFRHYSPVRQRWLQRDPAGYMDSANLMSYVAGNPIGWSDPFGLQQVGQAGEFVGSDPLQFGSSGGRLSFLGELASEGLGDITPQDRLDPAFDEAVAGLEPSGLPIHRLSQDEWEHEKFMMGLHYWLDVIGNIPVAGEAADALNALIYMGEGDWGNAAISGAAILLPLGSTARGSARLVSNSEAQAAEALVRLRAGRSLDEVVGSSGQVGHNSDAFGSIPNVNPTNGRNNCVNCAIATDYTLSGHAASAVPWTSPLGDVPGKLQTLVNHFGTPARAGAQADIVSALAQAGSGARIVVAGVRRGGVPGHVWNGYNSNGIIHFVDGQTGATANWNDGFTQFFYWIIVDH